MQKRTKRVERRFEDIGWLNDVREVRHPLDSSHPIFIREVNIASGDPQSQPTVPYPERHPYCEINIKLGGLTTQFVGGEKIDRANDIMFLGPDTPHYAYRHSYPHHTLTIYFLPLVLFEMGPGGGGSAILSRFTAPQTIRRRIVSPPPAVMRRTVQDAKAMAREWKLRPLGFELKLWSHLCDYMVEILRWEESEGKQVLPRTPPREWATVEKALRYIHNHSGESIYIENIAAEAGTPPDRLRAIFREALGTTCSHYVQSVRIAKAKALLCAPNAQIAAVAFAVGFETLSNFNTAFRKQVGLSPSEYIRNSCFSLT